jgi:FkbM family methyltransferase
MVLQRAMELLQTPGAVAAWLTWPKFSLASFSIMRRMERAGLRPATIIDVGANVGQFAVAACKTFKGATVISIEPDSRIGEKLRRNLRKEARANVLVTAVGDRVGEVDFNVNRDSQVSSVLALGPDRARAFPSATVVSTIAVPITTLDALFCDKKLEEPILLKIDVQGYEDRVVAGAGKFLGRVHWVLMEVSFGRLYEGERNFESIHSLMKDAGFEFVGPMNFHSSPDSAAIIEMDALFRRRVH